MHRHIPTILFDVELMLRFFSSGVLEKAKVFVINEGVEQEVLRLDEQTQAVARATFLSISLVG